MVAYFLTSLLIFVIGRLSPYERHRNGENLSLENSFWFVLAGFLQRSATSVQPKVSITDVIVVVVVVDEGGGGGIVVVTVVVLAGFLQRFATAS